MQEKEVIWQTQTIKLQSTREWACTSAKPAQEVVWHVKQAHQSKDRCSKCGDSVHVEGFQSPAKEFQCKACHKFGHFTSLCYNKKQSFFQVKEDQMCTPTTSRHSICQRKCQSVVNLKMTVQVKIPFACRSKWSAQKIIFRKFLVPLT